MLVHQHSKEICGLMATKCAATAEYSKVFNR